MKRPLFIKPDYNFYISTAERLVEVTETKDEGRRKGGGGAVGIMVINLIVVNLGRSFKTP